MNGVYWIQHSENPHLAIVARPRGEKDRLGDDLSAMKAAGIDIVVSLLEPDEAVNLGLADERKLAQKAGLEFVSFPITDRATPENRHNFCELISRLTKAIEGGKHIGVHCRGCIGRSTVVTASVMIQLGWNPMSALLLIEDARGVPIPDTEAQRRWIFQFTPCSPS